MGTGAPSSSNARRWVGVGLVSFSIRCPLKLMITAVKQMRGIGGRAPVRRPLPGGSGKRTGERHCGPLASSRHAAGSIGLLPDLSASGLSAVMHRAVGPSAHVPASRADDAILS